MDFGPIGTHLGCGPLRKVFAPIRHTHWSCCPQKTAKLTYFHPNGRTVPGVRKYFSARIRSGNVSSCPSLIKWRYNHLHSTSRTDFMFRWKLVSVGICPKIDLRGIHCKNTSLWRKGTNNALNRHLISKIHKSWLTRNYPMIFIGDEDMIWDFISPAPHPKYVHPPGTTINFSHLRVMDHFEQNFFNTPNVPDGCIYRSTVLGRDNQVPKVSYDVIFDHWNFWKFCPKSIREIHG